MAQPFSNELIDRLEAIRDGYFLKDNGHIYQIIGEHYHNGDPVEEFRSDHPDDPQFSVQVAAYNLLDALSVKCPRTGNSHRFHTVPAHEACVDCQKRK